MFDRDIAAYYTLALERERLGGDSQSLELVRSRDLLARFLPPPPARVLDVGGGPGVYAAWLAQEGYSVHLIDPVDLHVAQARDVASEQPDHTFTAEVGDARSLAGPDESYDVVLLMGPLYHLTEQVDRLTALREARRVVRPGGRVCVVRISRFASLLDGLRTGLLDDPEFAQIVERDLREGQHRNPRPELHPDWFTTAYLHLPDELTSEVRAADLEVEAMLGIEGPGWTVDAAWRNPERRDSVLRAARAVESEPSLLGASAHILAVARRAHAA